MVGPSAVALASETFQGSGVVEGLDALLSASANTDATFTALSRVTMRWSNEELLLAVQGTRYNTFPLDDMTGSPQKDISNIGDIFRL